MRINYNFPYYYQRLSARQRARLNSETNSFGVTNPVTGHILGIIRVQSGKNPEILEKSQENPTGCLQSIEQ